MEKGSSIKYVIEKERWEPNEKYELEKVDSLTENQTLYSRDVLYG